MIWKLAAALSLLGSAIAFADLDIRFDPVVAGEHLEPYDFAEPSPVPYPPKDYQSFHRDVPILQNPKSWSGTSFTACEFKVTDPKVGHPFHRIVLNKDQTKGTWLPSLEESADGKTKWSVVNHAHVNMNHLKKQFEIFEVEKEHRETRTFNFDFPTKVSDTHCVGKSLVFTKSEQPALLKFKAD